MPPTNPQREDALEHPLDICFCGDYRRDHHYDGACWCKCPAFRFASSADAGDIHRHACLDLRARLICFDPPWGLQ
jgi:hypothetical protein